MKDGLAACIMLDAAAFRKRNELLLIQLLEQRVGTQQMDMQGLEGVVGG